MLESTRISAALIPRRKESALQYSLLSKHCGTHDHGPGHKRSLAPLCPQDPAELGCHTLMPQKASLPHRDWIWCLQENLPVLSRIHTRWRGIKVRGQHITHLLEHNAASLRTVNRFLSGHVHKNSFFLICFQSEHEHSDPVSSTSPLYTANLISGIASSAMGIRLICSELPGSNRLRRSQTKLAPFHTKPHKISQHPYTKVFFQRINSPVPYKLLLVLYLVLLKVPAGRMRAVQAEKPTANFMAQESYVLSYIVVMLFSSICLLRKCGNPTQRQKRRMLARSH